jgi:hypothetical protein
MFERQSIVCLAVAVALPINQRLLNYIVAAAD